MRTRGENGRSENTMPQSPFLRGQSALGTETRHRHGVRDTIGARKNNGMPARGDEIALMKINAIDVGRREV